MKLHFTLRDLFWLILVVGMGCAWWLDADRIRNRNRVLEKNQVVLVKLIDRWHCGFTPFFSETTGEFVGTSEP